MTSSLRYCLQNLCNKRIRTPVSGQRPPILTKEKEDDCQENRVAKVIGRSVYSVVAAADIRAPLYSIWLATCLNRPVFLNV